MEDRNGSIGFGYKGGLMGCVLYDSSSKNKTLNHLA